MFTVTRATYALDFITLPISFQGNGAYLRVRLATNNNNQPGTTLEVLSDGQNIWPSYPLNSAVQLASTTHPTLVLGQSYWIVTELRTTPIGSATYRWHTNSCGLNLPLLYDSAFGGGLPTDPWGCADCLTFAPVAFQVQGTPLSPVQEEIPAWPHDSAAGLPVSIASGTQSQQVAVTDGQGGAIVAWDDARNGNSDIYVQRVGVLGRVQWSCNGIQITSQSATQTTPAMMADGSGGAILVWPDLRGGTYYKLYAQRIDANGAALWTPGGIPICSGSGDQVHAVLVSDGQGGMIVAWSDTRVLPVDVYAQRVSGNGALLWAGAGVPISTGTGAQWVPQIVSDKSGGAIIAWRDFRNATDYDIYAQRVNASGGTLWTLNGVSVANAINDQTEVQLVSDELGGAIAVWLDARNNINSYDVYAQRLNATGSLRWINALPVCVAGGSQTNLRVMSDGVGGAIATWQDPRDGSSDVYIEHIRSAGTTANIDGVWVAAGAQNELNPALTSDGAGGAFVTWQDFQGSNYNLQSARFDVYENVSWPWGFQPVSNAAGNQQLQVMASDGQGGAIVVWQDSRNGNVDLYAQRFEHFGFLGNPEPAPISVIDIPGEQGRQVIVTWAQSYLETQSPGVVGEYRLWRSLPGQSPGLSTLSTSTYTTDPDLAAKTGQPLLVTSSGESHAWEYVDTYVANGSATYSMGAFTGSDSVLAGNPVTSFIIEARPHGNTITPYFFSVPIHGYSVDNTGPGVPTGLSAIYGTGAIDLHWHPNPEFDIGFYRIYRGSTTNFQVGPGSFFTATSDTEYVGPTDRSYVYKVTAVDIHGNESLWAMVAPWQTGVEHPLPVRFAMSSPTPNPARAHATIRWSLPERGNVRLGLFDLSGRLVSSLENGLAEAGEHVKAIPLHDDSGRRLASGLYFLRLDWNGQSRTERIAVVR